jgi:hypothetical protein
MQRPIALLVALLASSQAFGQDATGNSATNKAVTFAELEGSIVDAKIERQQVIRRAGSTFPVRVQSILKITIGSDGKFDVTWHTVNDTPRGVFQGKTLSGSVTINQEAKEASKENLGGGVGVWLFSDGTLSSLRTYKAGGAFKRDISFSRTAEGFVCTANEAFAREKGSGPVVFNSPVDDVPVAIVNWKQLSSTCRVSKPEPGRAPSVDNKLER